MNKRSELLSPSSCLNKSCSDEPIFVLCARDPKAAQAIRHWVTMSEGDQPQSKLEDALDIAHDMERWYREHVPQVASSPEVERQANVARSVDYTRGEKAGERRW